MIDVVVGALPNLHLVAVCDISVGKIQTEPYTTKINKSWTPWKEYNRTLVLEGNTIIIGKEPLLRREVVETLPDLHAYTICGALEHELVTRK